MAGRRVIIIGGARGIGEGVTRALAKDGASIVSLDVRNDLGERIMKELSATAATSQILIYKEADVSNRGQIFKAIDEAVNILGRLDSIVNVAGIERSNPAEEIPEATIDAVLSVNVKGIILSCQAAFPHLKAAGGGSVINFGSAGGLGPYVGSTCYFGSKD